MKLTKEEWRERLTKEQYKILRKKGTEKAFSGVYHDNKKKGIYRCAGCGQEVFHSEDKFDSGTGWPSFTKAYNIEHEKDYKLLYKRIEVHCSKCGGHLGHVFDDGPEPTHKRYCINSVALNFEEMD
ncbi:MAG: Peptide methionine sulfoxide reductase MsrB [Chlamydiae bacterium]|nr:Peptide methionine sulfoxide reductase MsrB [Chlamydiota bacterium]